MKLLKITGAVFWIVFVLFAANKESSAQQTLALGELIFTAQGLNDDDSIYVTLDAKNAYTRWFTTPPDWQPPRIPTSDWGHYSEFRLGSGSITAYDAPNDNTAGDHAVAWGWYTIRIRVTGEQDFEQTFDLDLRDADWSIPLIYYDTYIRYYSSSPHLRYQCSNGNTGTVGSSNTLWGWYGRNQNKTDLLVPVTATNSFSGGQIKMNGTDYNTPNTLNWGWTLTKTIEAISPQAVYGIVHAFSQWSDGLTAQSRNVYIDDIHYSYSFTAQFGYPSQSLSQTATAYNNGRRLVRDSNNRYHLVYESGGEIIYRRTNVGGTSWEDPLRISDGLGNNKYPFIVWDNGKIYALWQKYTGGSSYTIYFRANLGSGWGTTVSLGSVTCSSPNNPLPVLTRKEVRETGGVRKFRTLGCWKTNSGISYRYNDNDGTWQPALLLPSTGSSHKRPSLSPGASFDGTFLDIYATYDNGSTILLNKYHTNLNNNSTAWGTPETVPGSSGTSASCSQVTSDNNIPQPHAYIVWQGIDPILEAEGVYYQRKSGTDGSWSAVQS